MTTPAARREEALRSALDRLDLPLVICDESQILQPLNARATRLFELESLRGDLVKSRPSHPLSRMIEEILRSGDTGSVTRKVLTFPSRRQYTVECSGRSRKGRARWLVVLLEPVREAALDEQSALERFGLTGREFDVARLLVAGLSNERIAQDMGISAETVKTHVRKIFEKSGTHSRTEFLAAVLRGK